MKRKTYNLVLALSGAIGSAAVGLITYFSPDKAALINSSIGIALTALNEILSLFVEKSEIDYSQYRSMVQAQKWMENNQPENKSYCDVIKGVDK